MRPNARACFIVTFAAACVLLSQVAAAQTLTGTLIGTVKDQQGAVVSGAQVRVSSPSADWRAGSPGHERDGPTAVSGSAFRDIRARCRDAGICPLP